MTKMKDQLLKLRANLMKIPTLGKSPYLINSQIIVRDLLKLVETLRFDMRDEIEELYKSRLEKEKRKLERQYKKEFKKQLKKALEERQKEEGD
ncbi:MAG: hypothetical protein ACTSR3_01150 [Candidatus Helarchaeota archaeon]